jgi:hypothetical protein
MLLIGQVILLMLLLRLDRHLLLLWMNPTFVINIGGVLIVYRVHLEKRLTVSVNIGLFWTTGGGFSNFVCFFCDDDDDDDLIVYIHIINILILILRDVLISLRCQVINNLQ